MCSMVRRLTNKTLCYVNVVAGQPIKPSVENGLRLTKKT